MKWKKCQEVDHNYRWYHQNKKDNISNKNRNNSKKNSNIIHIVHFLIIKEEQKEKYKN